jgi:hypothetical protein
MSQRTLVIGLGSSGSDMVDLLLRELRGIDGSLESFPYVHAIKIDTAKVSPKYVDGNQVRVIQMHEHIPENSNLTWEGYLTSNEYGSKDWLTQQTCQRLRDLDFSKGAGNYRPVGQFGMVMAAKSISEQLSNVISKLGLVTSVTTQELAVFVVGFSGGGTCSGGLVTLLEAIQHAVSETAMSAKVYVLLSVPHVNFRPFMTNQSNFVPNTVGLLQSLNDARTLQSYGSLASTYGPGLLPAVRRSLVYNENFSRLAHLVSCIQPANADDPSTASQSVSDAVLAQILGSADVIGESLVNQAVQSNQLNVFTTKRATYPRQEIAEGLLATALDQALVLWTGLPDATSNLVGITANVLKNNDDGKHFGDVGGILRIAMDSVVQEHRLRLQSDDIQVGRASDYRVFIDNVSLVISDFSNELQTRSHDTADPAVVVIEELIRRLRDSLQTYPKIGFANLLRQAISDIETALNDADPTVAMNSFSSTEIEEVATDLSMQLNPVYRQASYTAVAHSYLSQIVNELGDRAVEYILNIDGYSARFRTQLRRSLTDLRNRLNNGCTYDQLANKVVQEASVSMVVSQLQAWTTASNNVYSSLVRQQPNVFYVVDVNSLANMKENTTATDILKGTLLTNLISHLTEPKRFGLDEVDKVVDTIVQAEMLHYRGKANSTAPARIDDSLLSNLGLTNSLQVPCTPSQETNVRPFKYVNTPVGGDETLIPQSALSVIELTITTAIPLDNLTAFTQSHTWSEARKSIRDTSSLYDQHRTIYPSNQLGRSELLKPGWPLFYALVAPYNAGITVSPSVVSLQKADPAKPCLVDVRSPQRRFIVDLGPHNSVLDLDAVYSKVLTEDSEAYAGTTQLVCERWRNYPTELKSINWLAGQSTAIRDHIDRVLDMLESQGVTDIKVDKVQYSLQRDPTMIRRVSGVLLNHFVS